MSYLSTSSCTFESLVLLPVIGGSSLSAFEINDSDYQFSLAYLYFSIIWTTGVIEINDRAE